MATITQSRPPQKGQQHSYSLNPQPGAGCEVTWSIDGQPVSVGSEVGGIRVVGIGASGTMTVEVTGGTGGTKVSAEIHCPGIPPDQAGPIDVGGGGGGGASGAELVKEFLRHLGLPVTLPWWLLWLLFWLLASLFKKLGADWPDPEEIKRQLREIGKLLPKWLRKLLDID